jgi:MYXO-CTERM domain-containing protein
MPTPTAPPCCSATAALALVSLFTAFGLRQRRYPGFGLWLAGLWLATAGALVGAVLPAAQRARRWPKCC